MINFVFVLKAIPLIDIKYFANSKCLKSQEDAEVLLSVLGLGLRFVSKCSAKTSEKRCQVIFYIILPSITRTMSLSFEPVASTSRLCASSPSLFSLKKPVQFTVPGLLPAAFLCYIFHITLRFDLYSNLEMYCFIFNRLLYSVLKFD